VFAVSFVHASGQDPRVSVAFPRRSGEPPWTLETVVPQRTWGDVVGRSEFFDRALVELAGSKDIICVDPPSVLVESTDVPGDPFARGVRRQYGGCGRHELAFSYGYDLIRAALPLFAVCQSLESDGASWSALRTCGKLRGDRMVAAEVLKLNDAFEFDVVRMSSDIIPESPRSLNMSDDATIEWAGTHSEPGQAAVFWLAHTRAHQFVYVAVDIAIGESAREARVVGTLTQGSQVSGEAKYEVAPIELRWVRNSFTGAFSLRRIVVGQFKPEAKR
jgi:hypothetical protein